jgi:hypothetical protein
MQTSICTSDHHLMDGVYLAFTVGTRGAVRLVPHHTVVAGNNVAARLNMAAYRRHQANKANGARALAATTGSSDCSGTATTGCTAATTGCTAATTGCMLLLLLPIQIY